ncbi:MAG: DUF4340 domain-containing protein [Bdellovibrionota bacterium]
MNLEKFLKITLLLQIVLLIFLTYPTSKNVKDKHALSHLKKENITKIILKEDKEKLELIKENDIWLLKDKFKFPASQEKVSNILNAVFNTHEIRRVGTSENALEKFKLTEKKHVEEIALFENEKLDTLYLGDTPEFKKVYIRNKNSKDSFVANLSKFDLGVDVTSWYQKDFLGFSKELVTKVSFNSFSIIKDGEKFTIDKLEDKKVIDEEKMDFLLNKLFSLKFLDILSVDKIKLDAPDFKIDVLKETETLITLSFKKIDDKYIVKVSNMPWDFEISKNLFNDFKETKAKDLIKDFVKER